jgi:hypothetical protein
VRAVDHVENAAELQFTLTRDTTPPVWRDTGEAPTASTGRPALMSFQFDEPIASASATWRLIGEGLAVVATGRLGDGELRRAGAAVDLSISLPFRPCTQLEVDLFVRDGAGNGRDVKVVRAVEHDAWGAVPGWIRDNAEAILDPAELQRLVGAEIGAMPYISEPDGRRFPLCIRHLRSRIEFVLVPGGTFHYGPPVMSGAAQPAGGAKVEMSPFYIARTEVSKRQFFTIGDFEGYPLDGSEASDLPIRTNRLDAGRWCARQQFSLPTEAQWEYAASGPNDLNYPWGDEFDAARRNGPPSSRLANRAQLVAVDEFPLGRAWCGALQMAGNLFEVCRDDLDPARVVDGARDPIGLMDTARLAYRVRGSSITSDESLEPSHGRFEIDDSRTTRRSGFRPVWELSGGE